MTHVPQPISDRIITSMGHLAFWRSQRRPWTVRQARVSAVSSLELSARARAGGSLLERVW